MPVTPTDRGFVAVREGATLRVEFCAPGIVRIRGWEGPEPPMNALLRYDLWTREWPPVEVATEVSTRAASAATDLLRVSLDEDGALTIVDAAGRELLRGCEAPMLGPTPGFRARFCLPEDERFFGLGDQARDRIEHRGTRRDLWGRNVKEYIPIPFVISTRGYGLLVQSTRRVWYDLGATSHEWFAFEAEDEHLDLYVIAGPTPLEIIDRYTQITGRPFLPPRWALGLWYICHVQSDARGFLADAQAFRDRGIPCDCIGLEPGWMDTFYDASVEKKWSDERFRVPKYDRTRCTFFAAAQRMGFKPGLWLCNDYDLSWEEERRVAPELRAMGAEASAEEAAFAAGHEIDEHFANAQRRLDPLTRPDEPWFRHLQEFVYEGAHWFKQDGAFQVLDHPDRLYGNGMRDDEMHNLYPLLYSKQMLLGFREYNGQRTFPFTPSGWAGTQRWTGTWTGDTGGGEEPLIACLNLSMSGHGLNTVDMDIVRQEAIHFGFLLPWAQLNSWNYWRQPWLQGEFLQGVFTDYARLRYRLLPYLYAIAREAHLTGAPMMRPMPLLWPDEPEAAHCLRQFLLGPSLLAGCFGAEVWLPEGLWHNLWDLSEVLQGGGWRSPHIPENRGGALLVPAGGILLLGPEIDFVGQRPDDELTVQVFAGAPGAIDLYEDDGRTFAFEEGAFRTQRISHEPVEGGVRVRLDAAEGDFEGAVERRELRIVVVGVDRPTRVSIDGRPVMRSGYGPRPRWAYDSASRAAVIELGWRGMEAAEVEVR